MSLGLVQPDLPNLPPAAGGARATPLADTDRWASPDSVWRAPLVPVALAVTAGIVADRYLRIPLGYSLTAAVIALASWAVARNSRTAGLPLVYLALTCAALGAAYHHGCRDVYPADDIG